MFTIIIPIDLKYRSKDIIRKAEKISAAAEIEDVFIIYGHADRECGADLDFEKSIKKYANTSIIKVKSTNNKVNTSRLRNRAVELVDTKYILLLDVDIHLEIQIFKEYISKIENKFSNFYIFPCLYLTRFGTNKLIKNKISSQELKDRFFCFSRKEFLHLASPSSVTLMKTHDYKKIGGFDENFEGHGFEDFDFLIRLCKSYNLLKDKPDLMVNDTARSPLFYVGFRKYLGELCIEMLIKKEMVFHLHHEKESKSDYHKERNKNLNYFLNKHNSGKYQSSSQRTLISSFIELCSYYNKDIVEYSILFENKPGHIDRYDTFKRKIKFIFN